MAGYSPSASLQISPAEQFVRLLDSNGVRHHYCCGGKRTVYFGDVPLERTEYERGRPQHNFPKERVDALNRALDGGGYRIKSSHTTPDAREWYESLSIRFQTGPTSEFPSSYTPDKLLDLSFKYLGEGYIESSPTGETRKVRHGFLYLGKKEVPLHRVTLYREKEVLSVSAIGEPHVFVSENALQSQNTTRALDAVVEHLFNRQLSLK